MALLGKSPAHGCQATCTLAINNTTGVARREEAVHTGRDRMVLSIPQRPPILEP